jgi:hypothetical protein
MATQYPNSGKISKNRYKETPKQPDVTGEIVMQRSALKELLNEHDGDDIVIKLSGWNMDGQYGPWTRLAWNNYKPAADGNVAKPQQPAPPVQRAIPDDDQEIPF